MKHAWCGFLASVVLAGGLALSAAECIWLEGESASVWPAELVDGSPGQMVASWGNVEMISGGQVLQVTLGAGDVDAKLPAEGLVFGYDFALPTAGKRAIWARIGYEWARSDFEWRVDGGAWQLVDRERPTVDVQPIQTWNELGWLELAEAPLAAGEHRLEFRHAKRPEKDAKGNERTARILHLLDCICIAAAPFRPAGKWRPGDEHRGERDRQAERQVFEIGVEPGPDGRAWTRLDGLWQYAAWEETQLPIAESTRLAPVASLPDLEALRWFAYAAPGDRDEQLPEQAFAHRYLLRTRLALPAAAAGRGFFLDVQRSNLIASVFVNGRFAGGTDTFHTAWQMDLGGHLRAGQVNELVICFKDAYYALNPAGDTAAAGLGNRRYWNLPREFLRSNQGTAGRLDMPVAADPRTGILETASLVVCGPVYTDDAFVQTSVAKGEIAVEITVRNPQPRGVRVEVANRVRPWNGGAGGETACTLPTEGLDLGAGDSRTFTVRQAWARPRQWWPDSPFLYWLESEIRVDGQVVDLKRTRFGFREWDWSTHMFKVNGVKWPMWADLAAHGQAPERQVAQARISHQNHMRYWHNGGLGGMTRREALDYFDATGMLVRSSGTFDGQMANYGGGLRERVDGQTVAKRALWDSWRKQLQAWVREERNHASIYIWSLENEITYINVHNLGQWRECEPEIARASREISAFDPTRPNMVDGGNCLRDGSLPVNGAHYTELLNATRRDFPDAAYTREHLYAPNPPQRGAWHMVRDRPLMGGEIYFAEGYTTADFATIGGDRCFIGTGETMAARGLWGKMLSEGYRWCEQAAFQFWMGSSDSSYWNSWRPVAVLCREWNWTWGEGERVKRTLKVFNSTSDPAPVEVAWAFELAGKPVAGDRRTFVVPCGEAEEFTVVLDLPRVNGLALGELKLSASRGGREVFTDAKPVRVLDRDAFYKPNFEPTELAVFDPGGKVCAYLAGTGIRHLAVDDPAAIPANAKVVVVGPDAVAPDQARSTLWLSLAACGQRVIILDQAHPLSYQALPANLETTAFTGRIGFAENLAHPVFAGLAQADFFTWGDDHILYRNAYRKGTSGGRSLVQCDDGLQCTALFESPVNDGLLLLCQLVVGSKLETTAAAQALFHNLLRQAWEYEPVRRPLRVALPAADRRAALLAGLDFEQEAVDGPLAALEKGGIAVVDATPANLAALAAERQAVEAFCRGGGWLLLWGLGPDGLAAFNQLVQHDHVLRKFERERVLLSYPPDPLAAGLTLRDVVMDTGRKMYPWMSLKAPDEDAFDWLVDHTDIAPFCTFPDGLAMGKGKARPGGDHEPRNMVNGFSSADNWVFTYTTILDQGHKTSFTLELPKEEELVAVRILPSRLYHPITRMKIYFDDDPEPVVAEIPVRENPVVEDIPIVGRKARQVTVEIADWAQRGDRNIVVIDNLWLQAKRPDAYLERVGSLLNIGALMAYRQGAGGIFLNQIRLPAQEVNPDNAAKKQAMVGTILANLGAYSASARNSARHIVYRCRPLRIADGTFNAYVHQRGEPGWFGGGDLSALPVGPRNYAGIDFFLSDFSTSPAPSVLMLAGEGSATQAERLTGIPVGSQADALFFLHTFNAGDEVARWRQQTERAASRGEPSPAAPVAFAYQIVYADGDRVEAPVVFGQHVDNWRGANPAPLPGADLAWTGPTGDGQKAAVWAMRWDNPRPDKAIATVDIVASRPTLGAGAVFAITAAVMEE